ncbi:MAG: patatin-like phospholipase family protein [Clostridia bacterium]|nr:patatin-like phospholipase family protein [Clostridia bacterium]
MKADAVFEGGGVKAIALVGALVAAERLGYRWVNVAGTSAGALVAALVAAGYRAREIRKFIDDLDFRNFRDRDALDRIPLMGPLLSISLEMGLYEGKFLEGWLREKLAAKGVKTFGDLVMDEFAHDRRFRYKLQVIAADISRGLMLVLPRDIADYGVRPDDLEVARAVRMSNSLPFYFEPVIQTYRRNGREEFSYIVDGAILSNFPVWLFDADREPPWPTFGFKLVGPNEGKPHRIHGPLSFLEAMFSTMLNAHDAHYIEEACFARTISIPTFGLRTTDFDLSPADRRRLYQGGQAAAQKFFTHWDFQGYVKKYRK